MATINEFILAVQDYVSIAHREVLAGIDPRKEIGEDMGPLKAERYDQARRKIRDMLNEGITAPVAPTADDKVNAIFAAWQAREPDSDPGDLSIVVQDDMNMVTVEHDGRGITGLGDSIAAALDFALLVAQGDKEPPFKQVTIEVESPRDD